MSHQLKMLFNLDEKNTLQIKKVLTAEDVQWATCVLLKTNTGSAYLYAKIKKGRTILHMPLLFVHNDPFLQLNKPITFGKFFNGLALPHKDLYQLATAITQALITVAEDSIEKLPTRVYMEQTRNIEKQLERVKKELMHFFEQINYPLGHWLDTPRHFKQSVYYNTPEDFHAFIATRENLTFPEFIERRGLTLSAEELKKYDHIECVYVYARHRVIYVTRFNRSMWFFGGMQTNRRYITFIDAHNWYARDNFHKVEERLFKMFIES